MTWPVRVLLALLMVGLLGTSGLFMLLGRSLLLPAAPAPVPSELADLVQDAGLGRWVAIDDLTLTRGLWATEDTQTQVEVQARRLDQQLDPSASWPQPWRLRVSRGGVPAFECGFYERLHEGPGAPWRASFCRNPGESGEGVATPVVLLRSPGQEYLRLILGLRLDAVLYPVE